MIKHLRINNFLGIEEFDLDAKKINLISGKNGKGKTSILEAIEKAFTNNDRRPRVVRDGADKAVILVQMDDGLEIKRTITDKNEYLAVSKDGFSAKAPQKMLQSLVGQFSFNPVDFLQRPEREQADILLAAAPITVQPQDVEGWIGEAPPFVNYDQHGLKVCKELHKYYYDQRKEANGEVKAVQGEYDALSGKLPKDFDPETYRNISLREKYTAIQAAQANNKKIEDAKAVLEKTDTERQWLDQKAQTALQNANARFDTEQAKIEGEIAKLRQQISQLEGRLTQLDGERKVKADEIADQKAKLLKEIDDKAAAAQKTIEAITHTDIAPLEKEVEEFEEKQQLVRLFDSAKESGDRLGIANKKAAKLDDAVKLLAGKPQELVSKAALPIEGLGIDSDGNVTINDRPIKNLSTSEQIKLALDIAKATSGSIKLVCIDRFESLDNEAKAEFMKQIAEDDFQYFITEVTQGELNIVG